MRQIDLTQLRDQVDCPACRRQQFDWLYGRQASQSAVLCGRNAVQITPGEAESVDLPALAAKLAGLGRITCNPYLLRLAADGYELTLFADGRAIVGGTDDAATARSVYARFVGHSRPLYAEDVRRAAAC